MKDSVQPIEERTVEVESVHNDRGRGNEAPSGRVHVVGQGDPRVEGLCRVDQPAADGNVARGIDRFQDVRPESLGCLRAREKAPDAHDRDRFDWFLHGID